MSEVKRSMVRRKVESIPESHRDSGALSVIGSFREVDPAMSTISFYSPNDLGGVLTFPFLDKQTNQQPPHTTPEAQQASGTSLWFCSW